MSCFRRGQRGLEGSAWHQTTLTRCHDAKSSSRTQALSQAPRLLERPPPSPRTGPVTLSGAHACPLSTSAAGQREQTPSRTYPQLLQALRQQRRKGGERGRPLDHWRGRREPAPEVSGAVPAPGGARRGTTPRRRRLPAVLGPPAPSRGGSFRRLPSSGSLRETKASRRPRGPPSGNLNDVRGRTSGRWTPLGRSRPPLALPGPNPDAPRAPGLSADAPHAPRRPPGTALHLLPRATRGSAAATAACAPGCTARPGTTLVSAAARGSAAASAGAQAGPRISSLDQRSPTPGLQTATGLWPVRHPATQQECEKKGKN
ncbi:nascent polypeptide-associated complex subunit alpha, muscle-specific form-like [Hylobates moloch]|uniref:nascent polypeptide-associated complex subunit alpha, muscle-specific form-like n=1 Tax=Hylobates moloch TaxID=81572 RepID=UPI0026770FF9|nr:nascent polypeptide-associated complex subunit alpha, muscle-specific form-like [Hylobates moloch]